MFISLNGALEPSSRPAKQAPGVKCSLCSATHALSASFTHFIAFMGSKHVSISYACIGATNHPLF